MGNVHKDLDINHILKRCPALKLQHDMNFSDATTAELHDSLTAS
jgi:hypothetical protein